jgi:hypothetical protein
MVGSCEPYQFTMRDQNASPNPSRCQLLVGDQVVKRTDAHTEHPCRFLPGMKEPLHLRFRDELRPLFSLVVLHVNSHFFRIAVAVVVL